MTQKEKIGVVVLIGLFIVFIVALAITTRPMGPGHDPQDSPIIQQRLRNLEKNP